MSYIYKTREKQIKTEIITDKLKYEHKNALICVFLEVNLGKQL